MLFLLYELTFSTRESIICVNNIRTRRSSIRPSVLAPFRGSPSGRSLERGHALLSSASRPAPGGGKAARPRGCVWLPPRSAKPPCPSRGLACRCVPPRQLGRAVGLKACLSCAVSAKPSALFAFSGCSRQPPGEGSALLPGEGAILLPGGIPPNPLTSYYDDDFHIFAEGNHHHNMRAKINTPYFIDEMGKNVYTKLVKNLQKS